MSPRTRGIMHAALAAAAFGGTTPAVEHFGKGVGPLTTALCLYLGSLAVALVPDFEKGKSIGVSDAGRVLVVGALGAAIAPTSLAWGLQHAGATSAALMLNLEAVFTVVLARLLYREPIGRRMMIALAFIVAGGMLLPLRTHRDFQGGTGLALVALATFAWAADNTLARPLAQRRSRSVVLWKSLVGVVLSAILARALDESMPDLRRALGLFACGVLGYGVSLKLYVHAQRELGAARTGSVFGFAPLVGAAIAVALGDRSGLEIIVISAIAIMTGLVVLATEKKQDG